MIGLWAMKRANGDWFALDNQGKSKVPLFHSKQDAMRARKSNVEMLVFTPAAIEGHELEDLLRLCAGADCQFWLVDQEATNMKRGQSIDGARLREFVSSSAPTWT